jgi:3-oxoacyl-[acyl-carrier protein] reductase
MKRALVTGGSGSLGSAIARRLAAAGHHVVIHAHRRIDIADALAAELRDQSCSAEAVQFDLVDPAATQGAMTRLLADGPIQILVNNAGIHDDVVLPGMAREQWSRVLDVSLNGFFNVTQPLLLPMIRTRWGRIVSLSSVSAILGNRGQVNYAAAKAGLHGATRSLSRELASRGITVNAVAPGIIDLPMTAAAFPQEAIERLVPMKRAGQPNEVADLVEFLASDRAAYITGQVISINGGMI